MFDTTNLEEPIAQMRQAVAVLGAEDRSGWVGVALSERLTEAIQLRDRLDAEILRMAADWDRSRTWEADGALSAASWLAQRLPISKTRARSEMRTARLVDRSERTAKSLAAGDISAEHARALSRVATESRDNLFVEHEDSLLEAAAVLQIDDFTSGGASLGSPC